MLHFGDVGPRPVRCAYNRQQLGVERRPPSGWSSPLVRTDFSERPPRGDKPVQGAGITEGPTRLLGREAGFAIARGGGVRCIDIAQDMFRDAPSNLLLAHYDQICAQSL